MPASDTKSLVILITGGHGFIGSHVAKYLYGSGAGTVRIVDIISQPSITGTICHEFIQGNLCDIVVCRKAVQGAHTVFHFAANMGGMGTIHSKNDFIIYQENHTITVNLLEASSQAGVQVFFYASSACVYPEKLQEDSLTDVSLRESDVWASPPLKTQGLYGLEKLASEMLIQNCSVGMKIRIARFHNVFGPGGTWFGGREKAPAAFIRKAIALKLLGDYGLPFEIWGSDDQRRSFLFIEDALSGILALLHSDCASPVNIGSSSAVTIKELANIALRCAGIERIDKVQFHHPQGKPVGVASRNSDNAFAESELHWKPTTTLESGMKLTSEHIEKEMEALICDYDVGSDAYREILQRFMKSDVIAMEDECIMFGILLPITSRGGTSKNDCISNLEIFARSLERTTWRDTHCIGGIRFRFTIYLAVDHDDEYLLSQNPPQDVLGAAGILESDVKTLICHHPPGYVCRIWRDCAKAAWKEKCDYIVLLGDDVKFLDEGWMRDAHKAFTDISRAQKTPFGFGCVAFTDVSFPGMPTFPIIHRTHMNMYSGEVIPEIFINQDGDPFLFQIYRRWNCSMMMPSKISNNIGGSSAARYTKEHITDWSFDTLDGAISTAGKWLHDGGCLVERGLTLDVVIPCYRVNLPILETILNLKVSSSCSVMFIIIIDNPFSPHISELQLKYSHRPDVRIRVNKINLGASASRNAGMQESSADWIHFLDDDIVPREELLLESEHIIRANPTAAGFVGNCVFPLADRVFTTAVHLAGVTYFWDIATKWNREVPWGVTANLIARRNVRDSVEFDRRYPKTGGGEDVDFCLRKREFSVDQGGEGFLPAPKVEITHPWWNNGARSYWRFYMWAFGDGALIERFPSYTYRDFPNSAEVFLFFTLGLITAIIFCHASFLGD